MNRIKNFSVVVLLTAIGSYTTVLSASAADTIQVVKARYVGPLTVKAPVIIDSMTLDKKKYSDSRIIETQLSFEALRKANELTISAIKPKVSTLNLLEFTINNNSYSTVEVKVEGAKQSKTFVKGTEIHNPTPLTPGYHDVVVKYVADSVAPKITVIADKTVTLPTNGRRPFNLDDNMEMKYYRSASLSPSGKYLAYSYSYFNNQGQTQQESKITELATGRIVKQGQAPFHWYPNTDKTYSVVTQNGKRLLKVSDLLTGKEETIARDLPADNVIVAPNAEYLIYYITDEGPKKQEGVFEIYTPDDRQPGYRSRYSLGKYDIKTGLSEQLTYGHHNTYLRDISSDSRYLLFSVTSDSIEQRPSTLQSIYRLDIQTMRLDTIVNKAGFLDEAYFFPGENNRIIFKGTPEAFDGIGRNLPEEMTPSMYDYQLFAMNLPSKVITPVTKHFNPSIEKLYPADVDGMIYFSANNKDSVSLYRLSLKDFRIQEIKLPTEVVGNFTIADNAPIMVFYGASTCTTDRMYSLSLDRKQKLTLLDDLNKERMDNIRLGTCHSLSFTCSRGYEVTGFYYLPADFDKTKTYPVIVDYYGGCSPTVRRFGGGSHYPAHYWNSLGYIVLIVNPSGAAGFGQEWAARHVNTAGEGVAEDIIEATEWFADNNTWVNKEKIGCVSASYGGFMTQALLSKTDLFACGISHAGISSHTSYWGEGYWGHSYSEVSMADSYPWNRKDLYVERSPLYNADKIKRPILFTHGTADTNVPIGESIQMYTAMKILGVPTAFVMVEGENHGIMDYTKRKKWINTMVAWFSRWLKDDDSWWNAMYPKVE